MSQVQILSIRAALQSAPSAYSILIISTIVTGVVAPLASFFLRLFSDPGSSDDLAVISDIVRYIFTWLGPFYPFGRSFLGWISVCGATTTSSRFLLIFSSFRFKRKITAVSIKLPWNNWKGFANCSRKIQYLILVSTQIITKLLLAVMKPGE